MSTLFSDRVFIQNKQKTRPLSRPTEFWQMYQNVHINMYGTFRTTLIFLTLWKIYRMTSFLVECVCVCVIARVCKCVCMPKQLFQRKPSYHCPLTIYKTCPINCAFCQTLSWNLSRLVVRTHVYYWNLQIKPALDISYKSTTIYRCLWIS